MAERTVLTVKNTLIKSLEDGKTLQDSLRPIRSTPVGDGLPSVLLQARNLRAVYHFCLLLYNIDRSTPITFVNVYINVRREGHFISQNLISIRSQPWHLISVFVCGSERNGSQGMSNWCASNRILMLYTLTTAVILDAIDAPLTLIAQKTH